MLTFWLTCSRPFAQSALMLHHSDFAGRKINVELTAGGGGKGEVNVAEQRRCSLGLALSLSWC
jgi:hypothetical protein